LSLKETLRIAELPELIDRGVIARENDDYLYNLLDGVLGYKVSEADPAWSWAAAIHPAL
jgi:hypothetical protein